MAIEGPLKDLSIQDVLQLLELARKTGVLTIRSERLSDQAAIHLDGGAIVLAMRRRAMRRLGQQLLRTGKLTQRELDRALELQRASPSQRLGEILLEMGSVSEAELVRQLRFQLEETMYDLMSWDEGYFRFEEQPEPVSCGLDVRIRVESLLMEGARRIDEWSRLESRIPGLGVVPTLVPPGDADVSPLDLRPDEWEVLAEIDAERDLRQIAADLGRSSFDVAKIMYGLVSTGVVEIQERPVSLQAHEAESAIREVEALLANGRLDAAAKRIGALQQALPDRADLALLAGRILLAQGRMRAATEALLRAVSLDPSSAEAQYELGFAATRTGELDRAAEAWSAFLRLDMNDSRRPLVAEGLRAVEMLRRTLLKQRN